MDETPEGFLLVPGPERRTSASLVFDVVSRSGGPTRICKRLGPRALTEPWARERLRAEGELLARLTSSATPRLVASGDDRAGPWLVLERATGEPLSVRIGDVMRVARGAFAALAQLHEAGVIHGDVSPDNVVATEDGARVTLVDLSLGAWPGAPALPPGPFRGTLAYVAPEVARGDAIDARSDVFSLAATILYAASGEDPRPGASAAAMLLAAGEQTLEDWARRAAGRLPEAAARALVACCAFEPGERPASSRQVTAHL